MKKTAFLILIACVFALSACSKQGGPQNIDMPLFETPVFQENQAGSETYFEQNPESNAYNLDKNIYQQGQNPNKQEQSPYQAEQTQNPYGPEQNPYDKEQDAASFSNAFFDNLYQGPPSKLDPSLKHFSDFPVFKEPEFLDYDFSVLSKTVVYGLVYDVLVNAENYVGKFLKLRGVYMPYQEENGETYHLLLVYDENACCEMAVELLPTKGSAPSFPEANDTIEVSGLVDICNDNGTRFVALRINQVKAVDQ
jgi:hypothetical protein